MKEDKELSDDKYPHQETEGYEDFKKLLSYRDSTKTSRRISLTAIVGSFLFATFMYVYNDASRSQVKEQIYMMDKNGNVAIANLEDYTTNHKTWESKAHIIDGIKYLFQVSEDNFEKRIEKGLFYFGKSGLAIAEDYTRVKFKQSLQANNASTEVIIEPKDITLEINSKGIYEGRVTFIQVFKAVGVTNKNGRKLTYEFKLSDYDRSDNNLHGIKIEPFTLVNQETIKP